MALPLVEIFGYIPKYCNSRNVLTDETFWALEPACITLLAVAGWSAGLRFAAPHAATGAELAGRASVIDSDTIEVHGQRIRLFGIDAPESVQLCRGEDSPDYRCGSEAAKELDRLIAHTVVVCSPVGTDRYGRTVATCSAKAIDLSE